METQKRTCCYCQIAFGTHEQRVQFEGHDYHPDCDKARARRQKLSDFFTTNRGQMTLHVEPRHHIGR